MKTTNRINRTIVAVLAVVAVLAMTTPASALAPAPPHDSAPGDTVPTDADRVAQDPAAPGPVTEPNEMIAPPDDFVSEPTIAPVDTTPPKIDSAQFGVGWPAALAVAVALLAVLAMALMWRRDEVI